MNWHFFIDTREKRALSRCYGAMSKGTGLGGTTDGGLISDLFTTPARTGDGEGYGEYHTCGAAVGGGFRDGYGWGNGSGGSGDVW